MIPTLFGRWQTRLLLMLLIGLPIALLLLLPTVGSSLLMWVMALLLGFIWDILYMLIQHFRWDKDFPISFQLVGGIAEGLIFLFIPVPIIGFFLYLLMFIPMFLFSLGPINLFFPRWRFKGGQFGPYKD